MFVTSLGAGDATLVTLAHATVTQAAPAQATPPGTILPVVPYSPIWGVIAAALIVFVAAYYVLSWLLTRPTPEPPAPVAAPTPVRSVPELQSVYLHEVDTILQRHMSGELSARRTHAALSVAVREFLAEATGIPADKMTLTELRTTPFVGATHAIAEYYPIVFGADEARSVEHGALAAKQVIALWR